MWSRSWTSSLCERESCSCGGTANGAEQRCQGIDRPFVERCDHVGDCVAFGRRNECTGHAIELHPRRGPNERVGVEPVIILTPCGKDYPVFKLHFELGGQPLRKSRRLARFRCYNHL